MRGISIYKQIQFALAPSRARREAMRNMLYIIGLLCLFGIVGRMDYEDQLMSERQAAQEDARLQRAALVSCINGGAPGLYTVDREGHRNYLVCDPAYTVSTKNVRRGS